MEDKGSILLVIGFLCTLVFELPVFNPGVYNTWFIGAKNMDYVSLQWFVHDIGEHLHTFFIYFFLFRKSKHYKRSLFIMLVLWCLSLLNYLYNYHTPLFWDFDFNYIIGGVMVLMWTVNYFKNRKQWKS